MAKGQQHVFAEDSDVDSINTTTTAASDQDSDKQYDVEKILAEERAIDGEMQYLLKWERYPMYRCTWEKKLNIESEILFADWEKWKRRAKQGKEPLFDVNKFYQAFEEWEDEKAEKGRRRKAKRRKRGKIVPSSGDDTSFEDEPEPEPQPSRRTRVPTSPIKRKGVAEHVATQRRSTIPMVDDDGAEEEAESSDEDSLFGERRRNAPVLVPPKRKSDVRAATTTAPRKGITSSTTTVPSAAAPKRKFIAETTNACASGTAPRSSDLSPAEKAQSLSGAAKKSAPSASAKPNATSKPSNVFTGDWTEEKQKRQRVRVSGETPKDSTDPKFTRLAIQNRYQKYSKNEPAPNPDALATVDPRTGRIEPPKTTNVRPGLVGTHSAFSRRTPPPASRPRSPSPRSPEVVPVPQAQTQGLPGTTDARKKTMCMRWASGTCGYREDKCFYAHHQTDARTNREVKKATTCYYWQDGRRCMKSDRECDFAHWDTGVYAGRPGSYKMGSMVVNAPVARESDLTLITGEVRENRVSDNAAQAGLTAVSQSMNSGNQFADRPVTAPAPGIPTFDRPIVSAATTSAVRDIPLAKALVAPYRATSDTDANRINQTVFPSDAMDIDQEDSTTVPASVDRASLGKGDKDAVDSTPGTGIDGLQYTAEEIATELEMAREGIQKLDTNRLLADKNGRVIKHVYIYFPAERIGCMQLLKRYFEGLNCEVLISKNPGSWALFRKNYGKSSLLILHPSEMFYGTIPDLHSFVAVGGIGVRVFSIGVQDRICKLEGRELAFEAQRIFPHGGITFLTDDVLMYYPEKATEIIEQFMEATRFKPPGAELNKIGARPGVKQWMLDMAMKQLDAQGGKPGGRHEKLMFCWLALDKLSPMDDEDPYYYPQSVPRKSSNLWSDNPEFLPSIQGRWESGDEEGVTDYMANFFAGTAIEWLLDFRKFFFVYQRPDVQEVDPKGWGKKYSHIGVVRPDQLLKIMVKKPERERASPAGDKG